MNIIENLTKGIKRALMPDYSLKEEGSIPLEKLRQGAYSEYVINVEPKKLKKKSITVERDQKGNKKNFNFDLSSYLHHEERTASGRRCVDIGDLIADQFRGDSLSVVYAKTAIWLKHLGIQTSIPELKERYAGKNPGIQRMCLGNLLRGALRDPANRGATIPQFKMI